MQDENSILLGHVQHAIFVLEPDMAGVPRYRGISDFACSAIGKSRDEILGQTAREIYPGRLGEIAYMHHLDTLETGKEREYEITLPLEDGLKLVKTHLTPVKDNEGYTNQIVGSSEDISGGQLFREMQTEMTTINAEIENFVNLAAHDLRTPMRNVSEIAQLLREDFTDHGDGKLELIDMLEEVGEKSMKLIGDVLLTAQAGSLQSDVTSFDFGELVEDVGGMLDPHKEHMISHNTGRLTGDRTATQIVLRNLVDNSIKYSRPVMGGPRTTQLRMMIGVTDLANGFYEVTVTDNGSGFSEAALCGIDKGATVSVENGYGLRAIKRLIDARKGHLTVSNRTGAKGAKVTFSLPGQLQRLAC